MYTYRYHFVYIQIYYMCGYMQICILICMYIYITIIIIIIIIITIIILLLLLLLLCIIDLFINSFIYLFIHISMYLFIVFAYAHTHIYIVQMYPGRYIPQFWWIDHCENQKITAIPGLCWNTSLPNQSLHDWPPLNGCSCSRAQWPRTESDSGPCHVGITSARMAKSSAPNHANAQSSC